MTHVEMVHTAKSAVIDQLPACAVYTFTMVVSKAITELSKPGLYAI